MIKKLLPLALAVCMTISLSSCSIPFVDKQETEFPVTMGHSTFQQGAKSAVVLDDNTADILIACGYADKISGRSTECTQGDLSGVQDVGAAAAPDTDAIAEINPDIVFADDTITAQAATALENKGLTVLRIAQATDDVHLVALYEKLSVVFDGNITGKEKGDTGYQTVTAAIDKIKATNTDTTAVTTACYVFNMEGDCVTGDMYASGLLSAAGAIDICADVTGGKLLRETLLAQNPNYIFCADGLRTQILASDAYKNVTAVTKNRVYELSADSMTRQGKTMVSAVQKMHDLIYNGDQKTAVKSVADDYAIEIVDGMVYTADDEDDNVLAIQKRLDALGYLSVEPTGYYGDSTVTAVAEFQAANSISRRDGVADYDTLVALFSSNAIERTTPAR